MGTCPLAHGCGSDATSRQSRRDRRERSRKLVWHSCLLALLAELCVRRAARLGGNHAGSRIWHRKGGAGALGVFASVCGLWLSLCAASWYLVPRLLTAGARSVTDCNVDEHRRGEQWASECIDCFLVWDAPSCRPCGLPQAGAPSLASLAAVRLAYFFLAAFR